MFVTWRAFQQSSKNASKIGIAVTFGAFPMINHTSPTPKQLATFHQYTSFILAWIRWRVYIYPRAPSACKGQAELFWGFRGPRPRPCPWIRTCCLHSPRSTCKTHVSIKIQERFGFSIWKQEPSSFAFEEERITICCLVLVLTKATCFFHSICICDTEIKILMHHWMLHQRTFSQT